MQRVSTHAQGLRLRGVHERLAIVVAPKFAFPLSGQGRHAEGLISELNGWPACAPANASPAMLPPPAHYSGLERFATPFLCGSFIRDSWPALIGAFPDPILRFPEDGSLRSPLAYDILMRCWKLPTFDLPDALDHVASRGGKSVDMANNT